MSTKRRIEEVEMPWGTVSIPACLPCLTACVRCECHRVVPRVADAASISCHPWSSDSLARLPADISAGPIWRILELIGVHGGCRLRHLRQEAGLRQQPSLVAQDHQASFQPQHPARPGDRQRHAQAHERLHRLPQGRQGLALTR